MEADGLIWAVDECSTVPAKAQSDREAKVNIGGTVVFLLLRRPWSIQTQNTWTDSKGEVSKKKLDLELPSILRSILYDPLCLVLRFALMPIALPSP